MKILVVDDSATARQLAIRCLGQLDYTEIVEAENGRDALERLATNPGIELVLLDRYMPAMDGLQFIKELKQLPGNQRVFVAMVTSEDNQDEKYKTIVDYKADYYITKPITVQSLVRLFSKYQEGL